MHFGSKVVVCQNTQCVCGGRGVQRIFLLLDAGDLNNQTPCLPLPVFCAAGLY